MFYLGFAERPFFDRGGGFDDRGGPRNPRGNATENRRDEPMNRPNWNAAAKDEDRMSVNSAEPNDTKDKKTSRWGNSSPKSLVSDEENWDDEGERKNDDNSTIVPLPQTEPIDDSDVDFDDDATASAAIEKSNQNDTGNTGGAEDNQSQQFIPSQHPAENDQKSFDMFADNEAITIRPQETAFSNCDDKSVEYTDNLHGATECNTTPLYDEPEENTEHTENDEQIDIVNFSETKDEAETKKREPELPGIPGIDD